MKNPLEAKLTYRENAVRGATPIELVVILFDAAIDDIQRARTAIKNNQIEERTSAIRHAMLILQQLQGTLDFAKGGQVARQFEQFYNLIRAKLLEAQLRNSADQMQQQIRFMSEIRDCWVQVGKQFHSAPESERTAGTIARPRFTEETGSTSEWSA